MDKDAVKEVFLPNREDCYKFLRKKRWDEKGGVRCLYCLSQIITDTPQKVQENTSAVNVENILTTLLELSLKTVASLLRRCSTL
jgi:hypothetical protein